MITTKVMAWILLIVVWSANVNDLIRGSWFYSGWEAIIFWNLFGVIALISIIYEDKKIKKEIKE